MNMRIMGFIHSYLRHYIITLKLNKSLFRIKRDLYDNYVNEFGENLNKEHLKSYVYNIVKIVRELVK